MTRQTAVTLYHVTNRASAERMLVDGIGLEFEDYLAIYTKVKDYFNVPDEILFEVPMPIDIENPLRVWLYKNIADAHQNSKLAAIGGVQKGDYIKALISACAAFMNVPFDSVKEVGETLSGGLSEPVVVVLALHPSDIVEPSKTGASSEVYATKKISPHAILKVQSVF